MSAHWFLAAGMLGMAVAIFWLGWASCIMWREWKDDKALRAAETRYERHTHRKGDPQETVLLELPSAGRIPLERLADPTPLPGEPPWLFAGEQLPGWAAEAAEYELLHQPEPASPELTDTGEMRALGDRVVAKLEGDTNEWIFTHLMRTSG